MSGDLNAMLCSDGDHSDVKSTIMYPRGGQLCRQHGNSHDGKAQNGARQRRWGTKLAKKGEKDRNVMEGLW